MNAIAEIGMRNSAIAYTDRPTVKVIIKNNDDKVLIINSGLLPGGGIDPGEDNSQAINRELKEELGVSVVDTVELGTVIQYRDFLQKRYIVYGYLADLYSWDGQADPQDEGEARLAFQWLSKLDALKLVSDSIAKFDGKVLVEDSEQGRLFNLITTRELLSVMK